MKSISLNRWFAGVAVLATSMFFTSCDEDLIKVNVPLEYSEATFVIPATTQSGEFSDTITVDTDIDSILNSKNVNKNNIKSVKIQKLTLTLVDCDDDVHFGVIENAKASISVNGGAYATLGEVNNNPDVKTCTLDIPVTDTNLKDYLSQNAFSFKLDLKTRRAVAHDATVKAYLKFDVEF